MTISVAAHQSWQNKATATSYTLTPSTMPVSGQYVIILVTAQASGSIDATDSLGTNFLVLQGYGTNGITTYLLGATINSSPSSYTVTPTFPSSQSQTFEVIYLSGSNGNVVSSGGSAGNSTTESAATTYTTSAFTPATNSNFLIYAAGSNAATVPVDATTGGVTIDGIATSGKGAATNVAHVISDLQLSYPNTYTLSWNTLSSSYSTMVWQEFNDGAVVSDTTPPANVTNLSYTSTTSQVVLTWTNPTDSDFNHTNIYRNGTLLGNTSTGTYTDSGLSASTTYTYKVTSVDTTGNESTGTTISATTQSQAPSGQPPATPTNLFPFNGAAWTMVTFQASVTDPDSVNLTFKVDYSLTDSTLATFTTLTTAVTLPSAGSTVTATINPSGITTTGQWVYWRAYVSDDTGNTSAKTSIFSQQLNTSSGSNIETGVAFEQQGDPNVNPTGIDVSDYQGTVNWSSMASAGVKFAFLCTHHGSGANDTQFVTNVTNSKAQGIITGGYYYANPASPTLSLSDADTQAETFASLLQQGYGTGQYGDLLPIVDIEDNSSKVAAGQTTLDMTVADLLSWVNEFRNHFESITGRKLMLYTGDYFVRNQRNNFNWDDSLNGPAAGTSGNPLRNMHLWIQGYIEYARYQGYVMPVQGGWTRWQAFQYYDKGNVGGITPIDQDMADNIDVIKPPNTPTGLACTDDGTNITVTWNTTTEVDVHNWQIWVDGSQVGSTTNQGSYVITGASSGVPHNIEVRPIDDYGDKPNISATISYTMGTATTAPLVTIDSISRSKISAQTGDNTSIVTFHFDKDVSAWTVNVNGADHTTGTVAETGSGSGGTSETVANLQSMTVSTVDTYTVGQLSSGTQTITAGTQQQATINNTEMYQEGGNRVNIYGQSNVDGTWTPYDNV